MNTYLNKTIDYPDGNGGYVTVADIFKGFKFLEKYKNNQGYYQEWSIQDGQTPEIVSDLVYQTPDFWWAILIFNGIYDPLFDWPMSNESLETWAAKLHDPILEPALYLETLQELVTRNDVNRLILIPTQAVVDETVLELKGF